MKFKLNWNTCVIVLAASLMSAVLAGCSGAVKMPNTQQVQSDTSIRAASTWQTPLPHNGSTAELVNWWTQLKDPLFDELMQAAQNSSASLAAAQTRVVQARAGVARTNAALSPQLGLLVQGSRGVQAPKAPSATTYSAGLQTSWEIDVWGGNHAALSAAQLRARGAELGWHEARVAVAAEMASNYINYRYCENLLTLLQRDASSRAETARLADLTSKAGFSAPAAAHLARASSFDAANSVTATHASCDAQLKALVALSSMQESTLRQRLKENQANAQYLSQQDALFSVANSVTQLPAKLLSQRPDIAAAQQAVMAAALDIQAVDSARYPSLNLNGSIGVSSVRQMGVSDSGLTWGVGPIALSLPLTNQAVTRSNIEAQVAAYQEAVMTLQARARQAVREVEESLVNLQAAKERTVQTKAAAEGYGASLAATQSRYRAGLASLVELEDARRTALFAEQNQLAVERDRVAAWIGLYRATGGGWTANTPFNQAAQIAPTANTATK